MAEYRVAIGQRYLPELRQRELDFEPRAGGWVTILAPSEPQAREKAFEVFDRAWDFLYAEPFGPEWSTYHPLGELARIAADQAQEVAP